MLRVYLGGVLCALGLAATATADLTKVPLNSSLDGTIVDAALPVAFVFEGIDSIKVNIEVRGDANLRPFVRVLDAAGDELLAAAQSDGSGLARIPEFVPPSNGQYIVEVNGSAAGPIGSFTGSLTGKVPKWMKSAKFEADAIAGDSMEFFALAGTVLSGKIKVETKPHPLKAWYALMGPTGPIDTKYDVYYSGFNKYATLTKVVLPDTGIYRLGPSQPTLRLSGKVKLVPPKGGVGVIHVGSEPFVASLPIPLLDPLPSATKNNSITVSGAAAGATQVEIVADPNVVVGDVVNGVFSAVIPLAQNAHNVVQVIALGANGARSGAAIARVTHDAEPPLLNILTPINNASLAGSTVHVSGIVGDRLTPQSGVTVTVNLLPANVELDLGQYGSFERRDLPLGASTTAITVIAKDALNNSVTKTVTVKKATITNVPLLIPQSGDNQSGLVGSELAAPLIVKVTQASGLAFPNKLVEFKVSRGDGRLGTTPGFGAGANRLLITTDAAGLASVRYRLGTDFGFGSNRVTVSSAGVTGAAEFSFGSTALGASRLAAVGGGAQLGPAGSELRDLLVARVTDGRNPIAGATVRFQVLTGGGVLGNKAFLDVTTDVLGLARAPWRLGKLAETQRVAAMVAGIDEFVTFDAAGLPTSLAQSTSLSGVVHDLANRTLGGANVSLFVNGVAFAQATTNIDGRFFFGGLPPGGTARVQVDGTSINLLGHAGTGSGVAPQFMYGSRTLEPFALTRGAANVLPFPILLPTLDQGRKTYSGIAPLVFTDSNVDGFKLTLPALTLVTLANGLPVPGAGGSVAIGVAAIDGDDLPFAMPDGLVSSVAFAVDPPQMKFGTPLEIEVPNVQGIPAGGRGMLLQFESETGRADVVAHLTSNGRTLVTDPGTGLTRSGVFSIAVIPPAITSRVDCAGLALRDLFATLDVANDSLKHDVAHAGAIEDSSESFLDALDAWDADVAAVGADATVTAIEWKQLRGTLALVEKALLEAETVGGKAAPITAALAIPGGLPAANIEAKSAACGAPVVDAGIALKSAYDGGLTATFTQLEGVLLSRTLALSSTRTSLNALKSLLAVTPPPADALLQLAAQAAQFDSAESMFGAANSQFLAILATNPDVAVDAVAEALAAAFEPYPGAVGITSASMRSAGQLALGGANGGLAVRGIPADGLQHAVTVVDVGVGSVQFGRTAPYVAAPDAPAIPAGVEMTTIPPATVVEATITPSTVDIGAGGSLQPTLTGTVAYGPTADLTGQATGTSWRSSDPGVVAIGADGLSNAVVPGVSYVSARHLDIEAVRKATSVGNHAVTLYGIVQFSAGSPAAAASIVTSAGPTTTTAADGSYSLNLSVPSNSNVLTVVASGLFLTQTYYAVSTFVIDSSGPADAGIVDLKPIGNALLAKPGSVVQGTGSMNNTMLTMNNGLFAPTATAWNSTYAVWWNAVTATAEFDLGNKYVLFSAVCQADNNDTYLLEYLDAITGTWKSAWDIPISTNGGGLQNRPHPTDFSVKYDFATPAVATKVRIRATSGDGSFSVSELQIFGLLSS